MTVSPELISKHRSSLMGLSALLIFCFHTTPRLFSGIPFLADAENLWLWQSVVGVDVFFLLSSFGLAYLFNRKPFAWGPYLTKRFLRVWPPMMIMNIVLTIACGWDFMRFLGNALMLRQLLIDPTSLLWFVPAILLFYLIAPVYYFRILVRSKHPARITAFFILAAAVFGIVLLMGLDDSYSIILFRLPVFLLGFRWGKMAADGESFSSKSHLLWSIAAIVAILLNHLIRTGRIPADYLSFAFLLNLPIAAALVLWTTRFFLILPRCFSKENPFLRLLAFYGGISLEFYCVHEYLYFLCTQESVLRAFPFLPPQLLCLLLSTAAAWLMHRLLKPLTARPG